MWGRSATPAPYRLPEGGAAHFAAEAVHRFVHLFPRSLLCVRIRFLWPAACCSGLRPCWPAGLVRASCGTLAWTTGRAPSGRRIPIFSGPRSITPERQPLLGCHSALRGSADPSFLDFRTRFSMSYISSIRSQESRGPASRQDSQGLYRPARRSDAWALADLIVLASGGLSLLAWAELAAPGEAPLDVGRRRAARDEGAFSWRNAHVVDEGQGAVAGLVGYALPAEPGPMPRACRPASCPSTNSRTRLAGLGMSTRWPRTRPTRSGDLAPAS
jgi:hypothetical protein